MRAANAQTWQRLPDMPVAVAAPAVCVKERLAVVTGGVVLGGATTGAVQAFDLDNHTWSLPTTLNVTRYQHAQATLDDGRILIVGGRARVPGARPTELKSCELIAADLASSQPAPDLPMAMRSPTVHKLADGRIAAVGTRVVALFNPADDTWSIGAPLHSTRREHASLLLDDGRVLVGGGIGQSSFELVDLAQGQSLMLKARLPQMLDDLAMVLLPDGRAWVIGGQALNGQTTDQSWLLTIDPDAGSRLVPGPRLGVEHGLADHVVLSVPGGIVVSGGESESAHHDTELADAFRLDPATLTVRRLPDTEIAHDDAVGFVDGPWAVVLGGQVKTSLLGAAVPTPIRAVHRIRLDED